MTRKASETEIVWVMRFSVFVFGALATVMGILIKSIYGLWSLCSDLVYVILFPQLVCVVYVPFVNTYGALSGYIVAITLRLLGGEQILKFPAAIKFPMYEDGVQNFPFKTMNMLIALFVEIAVSALVKKLFDGGHLSAEKDILKAVAHERTGNAYISSTNGMADKIEDMPGSTVPDTNGDQVELTGYDKKYGVVYQESESKHLMPPQAKYPNGPPANNS